MKTKTLLLLTTLTLLVAAAFLGIYYFWDIEQQKIFLEKKIASLSHRPVYIQKAHLQLFPRIQVILNGVDIKDPNGKSDFIFIKKLRVGIALKPLLKRIFYFRYFIIDQPQITIRRTSKKNFNVSDLIQAANCSKAAKEEQKKPGLKGYQFLLKKLIIRKGNISFNDYSLPKAPVTLKFHDFSLQTSKVSIPGVIPLKLRCYLKSSGKDARIDLQGKIGPILDSSMIEAVRVKGDLLVTGLSISSFGPYLRRVKDIDSPGGIINGAISFNGSLRRGFETSVKLDFIDLKFKKHELFEREVKIAKTSLNLFLTWDKKKIRLPHITLSLPGLKATGKFIFNKTDTPVMEGEVEIENFDYQAFLPYFPLTLVPKQVKALMKKNILSGKINRLSLRYSETFPDSPQASSGKKSTTIEGDLSFRNFSLSIFDDLPHIKHLAGKINFKNGELTVSKLTGFFGNSEIKSGNISLSKASFLNISGDLKLDLFEVGKLLHSQRIPTCARKHLIKIESISGKALLTLDASGTLNDLKSLAFEGKLKLLNTSLDYKPFRKTGKGLRGTIRFTPYTIKTDNLSGWWADSPFICSGKIENYRSSDSQLKMHVESKQGMIKDLASAFFPWIGVKEGGVVNINIDFFCRGYRNENLRFKGQAKVQNLSLSFPSFPHPFTHLEGEVGFNSEGLYFPHINCKTGSSELSFSGQWKDFHQPVLSGKVIGGSVNFLDIFPLKKTGDSKPPFFRLEKLAFAVKKGYFQNFIFNDLEARTNYQSGVLDIPFLKAKSGAYREFNFTNLNNFQENRPIKISYRKGVATIPFLSFEANGGLWVETDIRLPLWPEKEETFSLTSAMKNISMMEFLQCFGRDKKRMTGTLNLNGSISGVGKNFSDWIKTLEGTVSLTVENGVLKRDAILSKIFSLLNVSRIFSGDYYTKLLTQGMYYDTIQGDFQIENGIARTESILLDSPSMKMNTVGNVNLENKTLDMEIAVRPLEMVDKVMGKIPILGKILMGSEGGVVTTYYKVTGTLDDPKVNQVVFQSLGRKAKGIFQRIFKLPETILHPGKNNRFFE